MPEGTGVTTAGIDLEIKHEDVRDLLERFLSRFANLRPATALIGQNVTESVQRNFEEHRSPEGEPWEELSPKYRRWKVRKGHNAENILILDNHLARSVHPEPTGDDVRIGTDMIYGRIHQLGGTIERKASTRTLYFKIDKKTGKVGDRFVKKARSDFAQDVEVKEHAIEIPARPYLGVRAEDWPKIVEALLNYLLEN